MIPAIEVADTVACVGGAVLAEIARPAPRWKDSVVNVAMGCFAGTFGPAGIEVMWERLERAHRLVIAVCALSGAIVIRSFLTWLASKRFMDMIGFIQRLADAVKRPPENKP